MNEEEENYVQTLQQQGMLLKDQLAYNQFNSSAFSNDDHDNLIKYQLELDNILERVDHLLRGQELKQDANGNMIWKDPIDRRSVIFNEYGVQEILRIISMWLNRNTILSNYEEETINWKVYDFGIDLSDLVFNKYEDMFDYESYDEKKKEYGWDEVDDTDIPRYIKLGLERESHEDLAEKLKLYPMIIRSIIDCIHSAYLRSLNGGERISLREARHVTQTEPLMSGMNGGSGYPMMGMPQKKFSIFKPGTW
jgi:hypothetical protein